MPPSLDPSAGVGPRGAFTSAAWHCMLHVACCVLHVACRMSHVACCMLAGMFSFLSGGFGALFSALPTSTYLTKLFSSVIYKNPYCKVGKCTVSYDQYTGQDMQDRPWNGRNQTH